MNKKRVVIVGAGPCGLAALKEMLEAGHTAVALEKGPGIGGVFSRTYEATYENLYLTISNMFMAFSDFPPEDLRLKYSSKDEYGAYLEAYADEFGLRPHIRLHTEVTRAVHEGGRWKITTRTVGAETTEELEADALLVATGSNHVPRRIDTGAFAGEVVHAADFRSARGYAKKHVLVVGSGESAFDIAADLAEAGAKVSVWSRSPITPGPRFINSIWKEKVHDEVAIMKDEARWSREKISDLLESMTASRMANAAPLWAYTAIRHAIFGILSVSTPTSRVLSAWNRQAVRMDPLLGDQHTVPTKSARLCTEAARGRVHVVIAKEAAFSPNGAAFSGVSFAGQKDTDFDAPPETTTVEALDAIVLCTGYKTDFSWLELPGLEWNPRTWFKHCFPKDHGDKLMFLGWARPHQGGIPPCAELLSRYIAMLLDGTRTLPADYAERGLREGRDEHQYYRNAQHQVNLVDYPAFMDSVAKLIGCVPEPPSITQPARLLQYWMYPNWPVWYRKNGPGARPELLERVLDHFPLRSSFRLHPFNLAALFFSLMQRPLDALAKPTAGLEGRWIFKGKKHILHDNA